MHETPLWRGGDHQTVGTKTTRSPPTCGGFGLSELEQRVQVLLQYGEGLGDVGLLKISGKIA
jgi:hypothetical protein